MKTRKKRKLKQLWVDEKTHIKIKEKASSRGLSIIKYLELKLK